jgi:transporter family-2 protein
VSVPESPPVHSPARLAIALAAVFVSGGLVALQSRITGELGQRMGDGFLAAFISFATGMVILLIGAIFWRPGRRGMGRVLSAIRERRIPWWFAVGGAGGALFVLGQGVTVGVLGVALFTIAVVCGQTISSLLIDHHGMGAMPPRRVTVRRFTGAALAVVAVGIAVVGELRADAPYLALLIPLAAGAAVGWQAAVNGQIRQVARSAFTATFGNFVVGTTLLGIALLIHTAIVGWQAVIPTEPWLYVGGPIGVAFIASQAIIVRITGVLLMGLALLSGQLAASVLFDLFAPINGGVLVPATIVGAALTLVAVLVAVIRPRKARTPEPEVTVTSAPQPD